MKNLLNNFLIGVSVLGLLVGLYSFSASIKYIDVMSKRDAQKQSNIGHEDHEECEECTLQSPLHDEKGNFINEK